MIAQFWQGVFMLQIVCSRNLFRHHQQILKGPGELFGQMHQEERIVRAKNLRGSHSKLELIALGW